MLTLRLSQRRYNELRKISCQNGTSPYPSYKHVLSAKEDCYVKIDDIIVTETYAQVKLQALLDLTCARIIKAHNIEINEMKNFTLLSKWGFDGASGQRPL